jgi:hypothetical protein
MVAARPAVIAPAVRLRYDRRVGRLASCLAAALLLAGPSSPQTATALRVRASAAVFPCVSFAASGFQGGFPVAIDEGDLADLVDEQLLVGSGVEITRAIEAGLAVEGTDVDLVRIPWVLKAPSGGPRKLEDLSRASARVVVLGGTAAYEARRALSALPRGRLFETTDPDVLRQARIAVVPLSLAGAGPHQPLDIPPIVARAALTPHDNGEGRSFLDYLQSQPGLARLSACEPETSR